LGAIYFDQHFVLTIFKEEASMFIHTNHANSILQQSANSSNIPTGKASAADASSDGSDSSSSSSTSTATITANDFLQLLVTELQNQDPTANTDPNEYVDQLVQVNSLQQLIQMNQTMDGGPTLTGASNGVLQELQEINQSMDSGSTSGSSSDIAALSSTSSKAAGKALAGGNLSPVTNEKVQSAAKNVATSLAPQANQAADSGQAQAFEEFAARLKANAQQK
jgi:flagellar basal-body rod modification protein FlgD